MLRKTFESKNEKVTEECTTLQKEEFIICTVHIKGWPIKRIRHPAHVAYMGQGRKAFEVLARKPERNTLL